MNQSDVHARRREAPGSTACKEEARGSSHTNRETGREAGMLGGAPEDSRRAGFLLGATTPRPLSWR